MRVGSVRIAAIAVAVASACAGGPAADLATPQPEVARVQPALTAAASPPTAAPAAEPPTMAPSLTVSAAEDGRPVGRWEELPTSPLGARLHPFAVASEGRLLLWGGSNDTGVLRDGAAYDLAGGQWTALPAAPIDLRTVAWSGEALYAVDAATGQAARWHADAGWTALPPVPLSSRSGVLVAWADDRLIVWGGHADPITAYPAVSLTDGVAYDPARDAWTAIASAAVGRTRARGVWTGAELVAWGGTDLVAGSVEDSGDRPGDPVALAYRPAEDRWRQLSGAPIHSNETGIAWTGSALVVFGYDRYSPPLPDGLQRPDGAAYDVEDGAWRPVTAPVEVGLGAPNVFWDGARVLVLHSYAPLLAAYDPAADAWAMLPPPPPDPDAAFEPYTAAWSAEGLFAVTHHGAAAVYRARG